MKEKLPDITAASETGRKIIWRFQAQDFAWALFVAALIATSPETNYQQRILVAIIGIFQIVEPRLRLFDSTLGQVASIALKLVLSYLLIGWTHGIGSNYYAIFLIPVVSAATLFELPAVILVTGIAIAGYFSFLLPVFLDYSRVELPPDYLQIMGVHAAFYAIVGFLVYQQAKAKRDEIERTEEAADRLAQANRELRETQASLRRSERLAALGQLTAGLAHELRNPLGTIKASAEMLMKPAARNRPEVRDEMSDYILSEVNRMNGLVSRFLDFARPLRIHPIEADLKALLKDVEREQAGLAKSRGVRLSVHEPSGDAVLTFDRDLLRVALSNLVQNAIQASRTDQEVELRTETSPQKVTFIVSDHGEGIAPQNLESVFNPFFTTKPQGVGLGLALVTKIVDEHGGRIDVQSELGKGTTFEVVLPRADSKGETG
jgi:two-component system, NtrC family, sensor histidine kinase HydH